MVMGMPEVGTPLAQTYLTFAAVEAAGNCAIYERLCRGIAADPELLELIEALPLAKRQPNLVLAAARLHGAPLESYPDYREWTIAHWPEVVPTILARRTQTNEPGRMRVLAPVLARLAQPLALLEVGASAGLCLYPDKLVDPALRVVWRAGLDLNPLDVNNPDHVRWLECLVWPSQPDRLDRLRRTIAIARQDPPQLVQGDLTRDLGALLARAPRDATLVVFHTAVLAYVDPQGRNTFADRMSKLDGHWISCEAPGVFPAIEAGLDIPTGRIVVALDGTPVGLALPHGQAVTWL